MALSIEDPDTERLARDLARLTGESIATATTRAIEERLRRVGAHSRKVVLLEDLAELRLRWCAMSVITGHRSLSSAMTSLGSRADGNRSIRYRGDRCR